MFQIRGVYEVAVRVRDLPRSEAFYREVLGLSVGLREEEHGLLFLRTGDAAGLLVLQADRGEWPPQHFAFSVSESELEAAAQALRDAGVSVRGPIEHSWIPAKSLYFEDPDGHELELCAPLE